MGQVDENPEVAATYDTTDDDGFVLNQVCKARQPPSDDGLAHEHPRIPHEYPLSTPRRIRGIACSTRRRPVKARWPMGSPHEYPMSTP